MATSEDNYYEGSQNYGLSSRHKLGIGSAQYTQGTVVPRSQLGKAIPEKATGKRHPRGIIGTRHPNEPNYQAVVYSSYPKLVLENTKFPP